MADEGQHDAWQATLDLARQRNAAARWDIQVLTRARPSALVNEFVGCTRCGQQRPALFVNGPCGHAACARCWAGHAEVRIEEGDGRAVCMTCCEPGCQAEMAWGVLRGICTEHSEAVRVHVAEVDPTFHATDRKTRCKVCNERTYVFHSNSGCGHEACHECWVRWAESQVPSLHEKCGVIPCIFSGCKDPIQGGLWTQLCRASDAVRGLEARVEAEAGWFRAAAGRGVKVRWAAYLAEWSPTCALCGDQAWALLVNSRCGHAACQQCWLAAGRAQVAEMRVTPKCLSCNGAVDDALWDALRDCCPDVLRASQAALKRVAGLKALARRGVDLQWAPDTAEPGPVCSLCDRQEWALLTNGHCGHGACERCWVGWTEAQLDQCKYHMKDAGHCFAPRCRELVALPLQRHLETQSRPLREFASAPMVARRRRLRDNALYPAAVQVDCPDPNCWGLGYLGFDNIMCFICERQWEPEEGGVPAPVDVDIEEVMGIKVKRCPKCSEYIEKNGGCDHMTCKCGHEFWWSTLQQYRVQGT